jgi:translation elongation factor EF-Tu-like GTPase
MVADLEALERDHAKGPHAQTREHALTSYTLGVKQVICAVNKVRPRQTIRVWHRTGRQSMALERGTTPTLSRRTCVVLGTATIVLVGFSERLASPSELLASPSELLASPSELLTSPSELLASPSELVASPSELLTSPIKR